MTDEEAYPGEMGSAHQVAYRRNVTYYASEDVPIKPLISSLRFITNRQKWGFMFRQGFFEIGKEDYALIARAMLS